MLDVTIVDCDEVIHAEIEDGVKGEKGDKGDQGPPVPLAQELGDDPNLAVSQKLLKDSIDTMESSNESMVQEAERLNSLSQQAAKKSEKSSYDADASKIAAEIAYASAVSSANYAGNSAQSAKQSEIQASADADRSEMARNASQASAVESKRSSDESAASAQEALESAHAAKLSEQNALASEQAANLSAQAADESESNAKASEQSAASSAQQSADSAVESAEQAVLAKESEQAAKGYSEQAGVGADRSEAAADRAEEAAALVEDKLDKSSVKDELGDSKEFVINQSKVTEMFQLFAGWLDLPKADAYADFENNRYFKDGMPCRFEDIFGFERLSEATTFDSDGLEIWGVDEPRIVRGKGLLIEPESTNYILWSSDLSNGWWSGSFNDYGEGATTEALPNQVWKLTDGDVFGRPFGIHEVDQVDATLSVRVLNDSPSFVLTGRRYRSPIDGVYVEVKDGNIARYGGVSSHADGFGYGSSKTKEFQDGGDVHIWSTYRIANVFEGMKISVPQWEVGVNMTSGILTNGSPATRLPDTLYLPSGYTVSGDYDDGINVEGTQVTGFGYIRKLKLEKK